MGMLIRGLVSALLNTATTAAATTTDTPFPTNSNLSEDLLIKEI